MKNKYVWQRRRRRRERGGERMQSTRQKSLSSSHTHTHTLQHTWNWKRKYFSVTFVFFQHKRGNEIVWQVKEGQGKEGTQQRVATLLQLCYLLDSCPSPPCTAQTVLEATQTYVALDSTQNVRGLSFVSDSAPHSHSPARHKLSLLCPAPPPKLLLMLPKRASFSENQLNFLHSKL